MREWFSYILVAALAAVTPEQPPAAPDNGPLVTVAEIHKYAGREVTVCGRVMTYDCEAATSTIVLDLNTPNWARGTSVSIPFEHWMHYGGDALVGRALRGNICATGRVHRADRRYRVEVSGPGQFEITAAPRESTILHATAVQACRQGLAAPTLIREIKPTYTAEAVRRRQVGRVYVEAVVLEDGTVGGVRVLYGLSPDYGLDMQAMKAVEQWRFRPGILDGRPVAVLITAELTFVF